MNHNKTAYQHLLDAILEFVEQHSHPDIQRFRENVMAWGNEYCSVEPHYLPATDYLTTALNYTAKETHSLTSLFNQYRGQLRWEQSYTKADSMVGDDMLKGYGFAEVIGKNGPFVSAKVRAGIGVWGAEISYPSHQHQAEEAYLVLAGSAEFQLDDGAFEPKNTGNVIYVSPMQTHGFRTRELCLVVFYIWQAGDLREKSTFV